MIICWYHWIPFGMNASNLFRHFLCRIQTTTLQEEVLPFVPLDEVLPNVVYYLQYFEQIVDGYFLLLKHCDQANVVRIIVLTTSELSFLNFVHYIYLSSVDFRLYCIYLKWTQTSFCLMRFVGVVSSCDVIKFENVVWL